MDAVTGLSHDFLNVLVFNFFPESTRNFLHTYTEFDSVVARNKKKIMTGSVMEHLDIPVLVNRMTGERHQSDIDLMAIFTEINIPYGSNPRKYINIIEHGSLKVIQDKKYPLHCNLRVSPPGKDILWQNCDEYIINGFLSAKRVARIYKEQIKSPAYMGSFATIDNDVNIEVQGTEISDKYDHIPCLEIKCPESILQELSIRSKAARNKCLPKLQRVVTDLYDGYIHVVYKPHVQSSNPDIQWRFSFSLMERKLARSLNDTQRTAYRVLKGLILQINEKICETDHKLQSYILKTTLFWVCEERPNGFCTAKSIGKLFLALLDKLIHFLEKKNVPHFFIPQGNLVDKYPVERLETWIIYLHAVRCNPVNAMIEFWTTYELSEYGGTSYPQCFIESAILQDVQQFFMETELYHFCRCNIVDLMRLHICKSPVVCRCTNTRITEFFEGCQKCLVAKFCDISEEFLERGRSALPKIANMWFIRSLYNCNSIMYETKAINLFDQAQNGKNHCTPCLAEFHINYALYLMARQMYEKAVHSILTLLSLDILQREDLRGKRDYCIHMPCFFSKMLDTILQMKLSGKPEITFSVMDIAYHLLVSCYIQAGVYTELILPPHALDKERIDKVQDSGRGNQKQLSIMAFCSAAKQLGDQYFLCRDYYRAAEWYITPINDSSEVEIKTEFVACIANLFQAQRFQDSVEKHLQIRQ